MKYAANGQLVALDEYLDYAPNLSALIEQDDAIRKGITMPDGHIYSCPQLNKTEGNLIHHYWINKTWLDNLGLEAPTTVDELYDVLVAFRDNDPNGNGQKDEIPYCVVGKDYPHRMFYDLLGSWGFGINGVMDSDYAFSWLDIDDAGNVRFIGREDKFKNMVEFYNKLWTEGLVDKESYSQKEVPEFNIKLDPVGIMRNMKDDPYEIMKRYANRIAHFHAKDIFRYGDNGWEIEPIPRFTETTTSSRRMTHSRSFIGTALRGWWRIAACAPSRCRTTSAIRRDTGASIGNCTTRTSRPAWRYAPSTAAP